MANFPHEHRVVYKAAPISWTFDPKADPMDSLDYEIVRVPTQMPFIDKGHHPSPHRVNGMRVGCTMEMVSALSGDHWTDRPLTADPQLGSLMIRLNDTLPAIPRQDMLSLVPRLVGTGNVSRDPHLYDMIRWLEELMLLREHGQEDTQEVLRATHRLLDEFDRRIGREPQHHLDAATLSRLALALAA